MNEQRICFRLGHAGLPAYLDGQWWQCLKYTTLHCFSLQRAREISVFSQQKAGKS